MDDEKDRNHFTAWFVTRPRTSGFLVFLILQSAVCFVVSQRYLIIKENDRREMSNILHVVYENVDQTLKNCATASLSLALTINDNGQPENFAAIGRQLIASNPDFSAIQLIPGGVIKYIYPLKGNEAALGLNILKDVRTRKEALQSLKNKKMYFAGPLKLRQGNTAVVGRLPVFLNNKFWGFSGIVIKLETLLNVSGINSLDDSKYYFQFSHRDPTTQKEGFYLPLKEDFSGKYFSYVTFPDSDWKLYIISKNMNDAYYQLAPLTLLGSFLAMMFGFLIMLLLRKPAELQLQVLKQTRKLLNSEVKYRAIFEQAAVGIAHVDSNTGNMIDVNEQYGKMLGYSREELEGVNVHDITHPDDIETGKEYAEKLKIGEINRFSIEKRYFNKSGEIVWANVTVSPLWKPGEKPTAQIAIAEDITLKKKIKERIRKSEARFKSLFEDSPVALWEEDFSLVKQYLDTIPDLTPENALEYFTSHPEVVKHCISQVKILDINNECLKLHKPKTKEELLSAQLYPLLDQKSSESFIKQLIAIVNKSKFVSMDSQISDNMGTIHDIHLSWNVMRGYEETLERIIISSEDITTQKESERIILNSQQKIESLVNSIDGILWECDAETFRLTFISKKVEDILGYTREEWLTDNDFWQKHIYEEDSKKAMETFLAVANDKQGREFEYRMMAKDGSVVWVRESINVNIEDGKPASLRGIMIDISKTKEAENDLNNSLELVNEQKKRLMNFSYIVSHNLRSHTANIQSITTFIETAESDEERDEMIQMLKTVSGSLNETMIHLNDLVNIQTNITLTSEPLLLKQYIENTKNAISELIDSKEAVLINNVPEDVMINYNTAYLESILLNLISNALRYSDPARKPVITIDWLNQGGKNILRVSDNGIGINLKRYGDKLFGMYKTFNGNADARGIGLFMTKNQIEAMNGSISVESEPGKGSAFSIRIK